MRLLIVDDEERIRRGLQMMDWASIGVTEVIAAADGLEARDILQHSNIDVVVSDIRMPGLDGLGLAEHIATHTRHTRVILLTGFSDFAYAQQAIRHSVTDYLLKPVKPEDLLRAVQRVGQSLELEVEADRIVREFHQDGDALVARRQILQGFQTLSDTVASILFFLAEHHGENVSLTLLAEKFHFSPIHISRMIKKETGYSFLDILTAIRLASAARLLRETDSRINQICEQVGVSDQRYFSKIFKKAFGQTPLEYRKQKEQPKEYALLELLYEMSHNT